MMIARPYYIFKKVVDFFAALIALILLSPLLLIVSLLVVLESSGPVFFTQSRVGYMGSVFRVFKFRTMLVPSKSFSADGSQLSNSERITRVGKFLRLLSIDEIPQLLNVLMGSMSIVGPRPILSYQYERLTYRQRKRFVVRPGITGLAQVSGRNSIPWSKKIAWDIIYCKRVSLALDVVILIRTFITLFDFSQNAFVHYDRISKHSRQVIDDVIN
jgi:undecaprenyl phosphate N,N'-diacetylbacillosamine 1-phosphate transferase